MLGIANSKPWTWGVWVVAELVSSGHWDNPSHVRGGASVPKCVVGEALLSGVGPALRRGCRQRLRVGFPAAQPPKKSHRNCNNYHVVWPMVQAYS